MVETFYVQVNQTLLKLRVKNRVKVAIIRKIMSRKRPPILRELLSSFVIKMALPKHVVLITGIINLIKDHFNHEWYQG